MVHIDHNPMNNIYLDFLLFRFPLSTINAYKTQIRNVFRSLGYNQFLDELNVVIFYPKEEKTKVVVRIDLEKHRVDKNATIEGITKAIRERLRRRGNCDGLSILPVNISGTCQKLLVFDFDNIKTISQNCFILFIVGISKSRVWNDVLPVNMAYSVVGKYRLSTR